MHPNRMNVIRAIQQGAELLSQAGIDNARFEADLLLAFILGYTRDRLYLNRDHFLSPAEWEQYMDLICRREKREPLQYILGHQEFMGLDFIVDPRVLIPRADSEILVEKFLDLAGKAQTISPRVADLCTGSGALAISAAYYHPQAVVVGTDISSPALTVARLNGEHLGVAVEWREGDFFLPIRGEKWDFILSNPPYVSEREYAEAQPEIKYEPQQAFLGGEDGLVFYRRLATEATGLLNPGGQILLEMGWNQGKEVQTLFHQAGFTAEIIPDLAGRDRVLWVR